MKRAKTLMTVAALLAVAALLICPSAYAGPDSRKGGGAAEKAAARARSSTPDARRAVAEKAAKIREPQSTKAVSVAAAGLGGALSRSKRDSIASPRIGDSTQAFSSGERTDSRRAPSTPSLTGSTLSERAARVREILRSPAQPTTPEAAAASSAGLKPRIGSDLNERAARSREALRTPASPEPPKSTARESSTVQSVRRKPRDVRVSDPPARITSDTRKRGGETVVKTIGRDSGADSPVSPKPSTPAVMRLPGSEKDALAAYNSQRDAYVSRIESRLGGTIHSRELRGRPEPAVKNAQPRPVSAPLASISPRRKERDLRILKPEGSGITVLSPGGGGTSPRGAHRGDSDHSFRRDSAFSLGFSFHSGFGYGSHGAFHDGSFGRPFRHRSTWYGFSSLSPTYYRGYYRPVFYRPVLYRPVFYRPYISSPWWAYDCYWPYDRWSIGYRGDRWSIFLGGLWPSRTYWWCYPPSCTYTLNQTFYYRPAPSVTVVDSYDRIDLLIDRLKYGDLETRKEAARELGLYRSARALYALVYALEYDEEPLVRFYAARSLGKLGYEEALPALRQSAESDPEEAVRAEAGYAVEVILNG